MTWPIDQTHDPGLTSWVESANFPGQDFPVQNLPFGVFLPSRHDRARIGTAIGSQILDLGGCLSVGLLNEPALASDSLNQLMALPLDSRRAMRSRLSEILSDGKWRAATEPLLIPASDVILCLPAHIPDYTDFYASIFHATNVGRLMRPDSPLLPNYKYVPVGYHGRASSIVVSGANVRRPNGQRKGPADAVPEFGASRSLDYELEAGIFIGRGNRLGESIPVAESQEHIFGLCLLNDWSARDIQAWEYQPLGPFLAKSFATTISPWVITMEALAPFHAPAFQRSLEDPAPLPYLNSAREAAEGGLDIEFEVCISSRSMRERGMDPMRISRSNLSSLYWTIGQLVTHHASNGCNLQTGDLLGTGTISGPDANQFGCLLEITRRGANLLRLPTGEERVFLEDGDEIVLRGRCHKEGFAAIGFGECRGIAMAEGE